MSQKNIVVVGAGVAGLTTALLLSKNSQYKITIAAKHMPGDYDIEYASPWAGANYIPYSEAGSPAAAREKATWEPLSALATHHPEAGIHFQTYELYIPSHSSHWSESILPDFHSIPSSKLRRGFTTGVQYTSVCINTAIYLPYLVSQCLANGVALKRGVFTHITDAAATGIHSSGKPADLVVNCTGLSSRSLGGVNDNALYPLRGQIVLVRNDPKKGFAARIPDIPEGESCYLMSRAAGGGTILGGCHQKGNENPLPDPNLATRIMQRCVDLCPELVPDGKGVEGLDVIRHGVGVRPAREGGARVEGEVIRGVSVVHNYGHGGSGYQMSYGCAEEVMGLVERAFGKGGPGQEKAKL